MNEILKAIDLTKTYGKGRKVTALDGVDLEIMKGEFISIQGPSGSGKSTLLNCLGCLDKPTDGRVLVEGKDVSKISENDLAKLRRNKFGFIFQTFNLIPILNAVENVELPMERTGLTKKEMRERAKKLLKTVGLEDRWDHKPKEMSGGEMQRVAIARALANKPTILLADEPTGNLDSKTGKGIVQLLLELNNNLGTTVIMVTHDPKIAKRADRELIVEDGKIIGSSSSRNEKKEMVRALDLSASIVNRIVKAGHSDLDSILKIDERNVLKIKGLKKKEAKMVWDRIKEKRK